LVSADTLRRNMCLNAIIEVKRGIIRTNFLLSNNGVLPGCAIVKYQVMML